jgi:hypothetical protein
MASRRLQSRPGMNGVNLKNIAGNEVSIFLFRFELRGRGIDFVLNEAIAADMYPEVDEGVTTPNVKNRTLRTLGHLVRGCEGS